MCVSVQAPVPYLNRAIAEEQLGVDAASRNDATLAHDQFSAAVKVSILHLCRMVTPMMLMMQLHLVLSMCHKGQ